MATLFTTWLMMAIRMTTPILYAGVGGLLANRAGILNMALEGGMLIGAFVGWYLSYLTGSPMWGIAAAIIWGALVGLLLAFLTVTLALNQIIPCIGINILATGLTSYFSRVLITGTTLPVGATFSPPNLAWLEKIIGPTAASLFSHTWMVYAVVLLVFLVHFVFRKTTVGLNLRAIGEDPRACETLGINVTKYRYIAVMLSGVFASLGGAYITLVSVNRFLENIVDGRGWIAMAAIIFGKYTPFGVLGACFLFGAAEALQMMLQVQGIGVNYRLVLMIPYVLTIVALAGVVGRVIPPASQGKPYIKE